MPFLREEDSSQPGGEPSAPLLPSPGRDSFHLMQDLSEHTSADPRIHPPPAHFDATKRHTYPEASHTHSWITKTRASINSHSWDAHAGDSSVNVVCKSCRIHTSLTATLTGENIPKCGFSDSAKRFHHFHLESWSRNSRYSSSTSATEFKTGHGIYQCRQCPLALRIEFCTTVTYLRPILQFQIVRAQFNRTADAVYTENAQIELESKIYMDRYVDNDENDFNARRDDYWKWKVELEQAQKKKTELLRRVNNSGMGSLIVEG